MRFDGHLHHRTPTFGPVPFLRYEEDPPAETPPAPPAAPPAEPPAEKTYTQAELNAAAAAARKADAADLKAGKEAMKRLAEIEDAGKTAAELAEKKAADAEARALAAEAKAEKAVLDGIKERIGAELGIPEALRSRLTGTTEEEVRADAAIIAASVSAKPGTTVGGGARPLDNTSPTVEEMEGLSMEEYATKYPAAPK